MCFSSSSYGVWAKQCLEIQEECQSIGDFSLSKVKTEKDAIACSAIVSSLRGKEYLI